MKKITAFLISMLLVYSFAACSNTSSEKEIPTPSTSSQETSQISESSSSEVSKMSEPAEPSSVEPSASSEPEEETKGKTLVVYYSASGNTERVAEDIAAAAGADLFEIEPSEPYTDADLNWRNNDSRVCREHEDETLRNVPLKTTEVPNWDSYDTVFIGYPIWWGIAAWPVDNFVKENDFDGKTVVPFATSSSSDMGESGTLLEEMTGTGDWQDGQRFRRNDS